MKSSDFFADDLTKLTFDPFFNFAKCLSKISVLDLFDEQY